MRQALFALLALAAGAPAVSAQGWANKLFKNQVTHDFGTVAHGAQLFHRFPITNIYAVPLEIAQIRVSCGCTSATPSKKVLQPRESGYIDVSMDARRFKGAKSVTVHVTVGPTYVSTAELRVSANSRADVVFNPGQVNFGTVSHGHATSQTIDVEYAGALDWRITEVLARDTPFSIELRDLYPRQKTRSGWRVGYQVKVTLKPDAPVGPLKREFHLRTNDRSTPLIAVLVEANVEAALAVSPNPLRLDGRIGQTVVGRVVLRGRGQQNFRVLAIDGLGQGLEAEFGSTALPVQTITFKLKPGQPGDVQRSVVIKTDLPSGPLPLSISGTITP
jgi:Protein of unknown function (DUF1573)